MQWTPQMDWWLRIGRGQGLSYAQIAQLLGISRNAVIGHDSRLRYKHRWPDGRRAPTPKQLARALERSREQYRLIDQLNADIAEGISRNGAIRRARRNGALLEDLAQVVGLTRERIRQIILGRNHKSSLLLASDSDVMAACHPAVMPTE
jgi:hypothetical protein